MKTKTPIKILTLTLFVALISGFTLHKGGYLFPEEKEPGYLADPNGGTGIELKSVSKKEYGLNTFQKLKLSGGFNPGNFDAIYTESPQDMHFIGSSKSMVINLKNPSADPTSSFLKAQLKYQFKKK